MFGWLEKMPLGKRLMIGLPISVLCFWLSIKLAVYIWVDTAIEAISEGNTVEYDSTFFRINGDFGIKGVKIIHFMPDGEVGATYEADRVVIHTPGLWWLLKGTVMDPRYVPDSIGLGAENLRDVTRTDATPGNYTHLPYDATGCGVKLLTPAHLRSMGVEAIRNGSLRLHRIDDTNSTLVYEVSNPGVGQLQMNFNVNIPRPLVWRNIIQVIMTGQASNISMSMKDLGFVAVRNAYCAKQAGISVAEFNEFHMKDVARRLAEAGDEINDGTLNVYREFARDGGELKISSVNAPATGLMQFVSLSAMEKMNSMPTQIRLNDGPPTPFRYAVASASSQQAALPATAPVPLPVAAVASTSQPVSARTVAAIPATPLRTVSYKSLEPMVGAHVEFSTVNHTVRRGTLMQYSRYMSMLKLDADEGGFTLAVPADTITQVRLLPMDSSASGSTMGQANAKTH